MLNFAKKYLIQYILEHNTVVPYKNSKKGKKEQIAKMFDNVAPRYDFLNRVLSVGIDKWWRWRMVNQLKADSPKKILDVATGTADVALALTRLSPKKVIGVDISAEMLAYGRKKVIAKNQEHIIELQQADAENLPFENNTFDAITVSFGVRTFENLEKGLAELHRCLKSDGKLVVLEFSQPKVFPVKQFYRFYSRHILPRIGRFFSSDSSAYTYLPESVAAFPEGQRFLKILNQTGFKTTKCIHLAFGISSLYIGKK